MSIAGAVKRTNGLKLRYTYTCGPAATATAGTRGSHSFIVSSNDPEQNNVEVGCTEQANTFAVGPNASLRTTNTPNYQWPEARGGPTYGAEWARGGLSSGAEWPVIEEIDLDTPQKLRKRVDACCN